VTHGRVWKFGFALIGCLPLACGTESPPVTQLSMSGSSQGNDETTSDPAETGGRPTTTAPMSTTTMGPTGTSGTNPETSGNGETEDSSGPTVDCGTATPIQGVPTTVSFELVAGGFNKPLFVLGDPNNASRLFVVEQSGDVRILESGATTAPESVFLHIDVPGADDPQLSSEQGLLGFAFHPNYPTDARVYVAYTRGTGAGATAVAEFSVNGNTTTFTKDIIAVSKPAGNHNGGMIQFGPDGFLYLSVGDGGPQNDQFGFARNTGILLGKILRIGVEPDGTVDNPPQCQGCASLNGETFDYTIPADNPFVNNDQFADEIFAWGFRNPWRFQFDPVSDLLYVADVGQGGDNSPDAEEVSVVVAGGDYGWGLVEGFTCNNDPACETVGPNQMDSQGHISPIADYDHNENRCSISGLGVYRAAEVPGWAGMYFYADLCSTQVFGARWDGQQVTDLGQVGNIPVGAVLGGGFDACGNVYLATTEGGFQFQAGDGQIYRIRPPGV